MSEQGLGPHTSTAIAALLGQTDCYTSVLLSGNTIQGLGAASLAQLLMNNTSITHLDLRSNDIDTLVCPFWFFLLLTFFSSFYSLSLFFLFPLLRMSSNSNIGRDRTIQSSRNEPDHHLPRPLRGAWGEPQPPGGQVCWCHCACAADQPSALPSLPLREWLWLWGSAPDSCGV